MATEEEKAKGRLAAATRAAIDAERLQKAQIDALVSGVPTTEVRKIITKIFHRKCKL